MGHPLTHIAVFLFHSVQSVSLSRVVWKSKYVIYVCVSDKLDDHTHCAKESVRVLQKGTKYANSPTFFVVGSVALFFSSSFVFHFDHQLDVVVPLSILSLETELNFSSSEIALVSLMMSFCPYFCMVNEFVLAIL